MHDLQMIRAVKAGTITEAAVMRACDDWPELGWLLCLTQTGDDEAQPLTNFVGQIKLFDTIDAAIEALAAVGFDGSVSVAWSMSPCN